MKLKILFIPLAVFLLLAGTFLIQLIRNASGEDSGVRESALLGKRVPEFKLESLEEKEKIYDQRILLNGKPTLLNVWATWCPTCRVEHQYLNQLSAQGIRMVGLNYKDDRQKAIAWLGRLSNPYTLSLYDTDGILGLDLGVSGAPETFLIDGSGVIRYHHAGELNDQIWQQILPVYKKYQG